MRRAAGAVWLWPMVLTAALGLTQISGPIMWRDELATWSAATRSVPQLWRMVHHIDAVHGTYYLGMHFWIAVFGDSPAAMRVPSVIAMTGAAGLVALTGRKLGGYTAGITAGLVFALIPGISRFAQEARPYAFVTFFAALATLLLLRALDRPIWRRWVVYALALAAAGASNVLALCLLSGHAGIVALQYWRPAAGTASGSRRETVGGFIMAALAAVVIDSPILALGHDQASEQVGTLQRPPLSQITGLGASGGVWPELFCSVAVAVAVIVLGVLSLAGTNRRAGVYALACAILPTLVIWTASQGSTAYWFARYLLFTLPAWAVAVGLAVATLSPARLARLPGLRRRATEGSPGKAASALAAAAAVVVVAVIAVIGWPNQQAIRQPEAHNWWSYPNPVGDVPADYALAASVIAAHEKPGDGIVYQVSDSNHWMPDNGVEYYLRLNGQPEPRDVFLAKTPAQAGSLQPAECADPARCLHGQPRLWIVYVNHLAPAGSNRDPLAAIAPGQAAVLRARGYAATHRYEADGITVVLMTARAG